MGLTVLVVDAGARAHAISRAYEKSHDVDRIIVAPGNGLIGYDRQKEVLLEKCSLKDPYSILDVAKKYAPDLIEVAQDDAVACGTTDLLRANNFNVFGPTKDAAKIEWDKAHSREFMHKYGIPAPAFLYFDSEAAGIEYVESIYRKNPEKVVFVKAAGLCAGKGTLKGRNREDAINCIRQMKNFGEAGKRYVIEDGLSGEEFSGYAISDGTAFKMFKTAQDNKLSHNFDEGDQTGGMGAVSPAIVTAPYMKQIEEEQIWRAINGMKQEGMPYEGILYLGGIMVDGAPGEPKRPMNIEYNARWGDPECQVVLPRVHNYLEVVQACLEGRLNEVEIKQDNNVYVGVVGASKGYPKDYANVKGKIISGIEDAMQVKDVEIFGAGVDVKDGKFYADGGRLFTVVGKGKNIVEAKERAHSAISTIHIDGNNLHYRTDVGWRDVERYWKEIQKLTSSSQQ